MTSFSPVAVAFAVVVLWAVVGGCLLLWRVLARAERLLVERKVLGALFPSPGMVYGGHLRSGGAMSASAIACKVEKTTSWGSLSPGTEEVRGLLADLRERGLVKVEEGEDSLWPLYRLTAAGDAAAEEQIRENTRRLARHLGLRLPKYPQTDDGATSRGEIERSPHNTDESKPGEYLL